MDDDQSVPLVHVYIAGLAGPVNAFQASGGDGIEHCILDPAVLDDDNVSAQASATAAILRACKIAARSRTAHAR